jgi:hypothetical protein
MVAANNWFDPRRAHDVREGLQLEPPLRTTEGSGATGKVKRYYNGDGHNEWKWCSGAAGSSGCISTKSLAEIGGAKFAMYTQNDGAWIKNVAEEARMHRLRGAFASRSAGQYRGLLALTYL